MANKWHVTFCILRGAELAGSSPLLEGTGKQMRHVKVRTVEQVAQHREEYTDLLRKTRALNGG